MVDAAGCRRVAADDRPVTFVDGAGLELPAQLAGDFRAQAEQQHAGGAAVQPVGRPDPLADLVAQDLDGEAGFVAVDFRAVDEQAGRLVDDDDGARRGRGWAVRQAKKRLFASAGMAMPVTWARSSSSQ
jgi:hypothetical protein